MPEFKMQNLAGSRQSAALKATVLVMATITVAVAGQSAEGSRQRVIELRKMLIYCCQNPLRLSRSGYSIVEKVASP